MYPRADLDSPAIMCSLDALHSTLSCWLKGLEDYTAKLQHAHIQYTPLPSLFAPPPPFTPLTSTVLTTVTYLTTLCAELAIYSSAESDDATSDPGGVATQSWNHMNCLEDFIGRFTTLLDLLRLRMLLAHQEWMVRVKGWWALIEAAGMYDALLHTCVHCVADLHSSHVAMDKPSREILTLLQ